MGYYTDHELDVTGCKASDYVAELEEITGYSGLFEGEIKWYSHEKDMRALSARHPEVMFLLSGNGEESGDIWVEYHKAGKMQLEKASITFGQFEESKLS